MDVAGDSAAQVPHRHSIATVALGGTLGETLTVASAAGFDGVELFEPGLIAAPQAPEEVRRWLADLGLVCELYQPLRDTVGVPPVAFRTDDIVEMARAVSAQGLPVLSVPGNYYEDLAARTALDADSLETYRLGNILESA